MGLKDQQGTQNIVVPTQALEEGRFGRQESCGGGGGVDLILPWIVFGGGGEGVDFYLSAW